MRRWRDKIKITILGILLFAVFAAAYFTLVQAGAEPFLTVMILLALYILIIKAELQRIAKLDLA